MSKNLQMSLKTQWFEMTKSGEKTEDYREITTYWFKRLIAGRLEDGFSLEYFSTHKDVNNLIRLHQKNFRYNKMTLGYPSKNDKERILTLEHNGIEIREGRPEWGAEPGKIYFVIKHGKIIE